MSSQSEARRWLEGAARPARPWILASLCAGALEGVLLVVQASLVALAAHGIFLGGRSLSDMGGLFAGLAVTLLGRALATTLKDWAGFRAGARVRESVRAALLGRFLGPGHGDRGDGGPLTCRAIRELPRVEVNAGALATVVEEQVEALHDHVARYLPQRALAVLVPVTILLCVAPLSWVVALLLVATAPLIPLLGWIVGLGASRAAERQLTALGRLASHFVDRIHGLPTLRILHRTAEEAQAVGEAAQELRRRTLTVLRLAFLTSAVLELFSALGVGLVAVFCGLTLLGSFDFGLWGRPLSFDVALFLLIVAAELFLPLRSLGALFHARAAALGAAESLGPLVGILPVEPSEPAEGVSRGANAAPRYPNLDPRGDIRLAGVTVQPQGAARPLLRDISLEIRSGEILAVVGQSGAGKSTLLGLLLGVQRPAAGRITVGDVDLETLPLETWRSHLAWVGQQPRLFPGSLRENILLGKPEATEAELSAAARMAQILGPTEELPEGLDTPSGELGAGLSQGQIQRVALARAILKDAPILLLDEPMASLDPEAEAAVLGALVAHGQGRTLVVVTHRPAVCRGAHRVALLADGALVEQGTHEALSAAGGAYAAWLAEAGQ